MRKSSDLYITGLTFSKCTYVSGGICMFGNMVVIEIRVKISQQTAQWDSFIQGLPGSGGREVPLNAHCISGGTNGERMIDTAGGNVRNTGTTTLAVNEEINISGVYLSV